MLDSARSSVPTARELRRFALVVGAAFLALGATGYWRGHRTAPIVLLAVGVALIVAGLVAPARLGPVHRAWMGLAHAISRVTTPIFMSVVYLAVLTPLGVAMRLAGRRPLARRATAATFWVDRPAGQRRSDLRRQF
jgi:hypothetical protein